MYQKWSKEITKQLTHEEIHNYTNLVCGKRTYLLEMKYIKRIILKYQK